MKKNWKIVFAYVSDNCAYFVTKRKFGYLW